MKNLKKLAISMLMLAFVTSCDSNENNGSNGNGEGTYSKTQFLAYTEGIAFELNATAEALSDSWVKTGYTDEENSKEYSNYAEYLTKGVEPEVALSWIIEGMETIADEVSGEKIRTPYVDKDVYGVESWYSFNSFTDYRDNVYSIQNVFYGKLLSDVSATNRASMALTSAAANSLAATDAKAADLNDAINSALKAFNTLVANEKPFRDYVLEYRDDNKDSQEIRNLIDLVAGIVDAVGELSSDNDKASEIVAQVASAVIKPTYAALQSSASALYTKVATYCSAPTQANLDAAAAQWVVTRIPWEQSEAFLFGPVDTEGYDPHLDSWPLSQALINSILLQNIFPSNDEVGVIYRDEVLGFHSLEYVLYKAGSVRKVDELFKDETVIIEKTNEM